MNRFFRRPGIGLAIALLACPLLSLSALTLTAQTVEPMSATRIPQADLIQPAQLNRELHGSMMTRPLVLQVGSQMLFDQDHIAGAVYAGPASTPEGQQVLRNQVKNLPRSRSIVIYCGCCPWAHCPNIEPAWAILHSMGFTHVKALYLADNFGANWISHGYPVQRSR
jgi:rhodanese-related sulfurtransferase